MNRIIIIGAGQAGGQVAASLRQLKCSDEILLFGEEPHPPYQRPLLSKQYLSPGEDEERMFLRADTFYSDRNIDLRLGKRIETLDPVAKTVTTDQGEMIDYQDLIVATGSRPRKLNIPGSVLQGIHYLRTLDDVDAIKAEMLPGKKLAIIGGGYIGLEVASVAITAGLNVTIVETEDRILKRVTTETMSAFYHQLHEERGVKIHLNTMVSGFEDESGFGGQGRVANVTCGETSIDADMVIIGIGILPNIELAQAAGLACDNGILVDEHCRTSVANIYAAGDCSNHPNPVVGRRLRLESVPNAMEQAKVVAANIMGKAKIYSTVPWFWSDQYEHKLQMVGFSADGDKQVQRGDMHNNEFANYYFKKEGQSQILVAVDAVNSPVDFMLGRQLYGRSFDLLRLADNEIEIKDCLVRD